MIVSTWSGYRIFSPVKVYFTLLKMSLKWELVAWIYCIYTLMGVSGSLRNDDVSFACFWARLILFINEERDEEASIGGRIAREEESHCLATNQNDDDDDGCTFWRRIIIPSHDMFWALNSWYQSLEKITSF